MPPLTLDALTYDLSMLARGTVLAERLLVTWLEHMEVFDKLADFDRMNQCIDSLTRIAAIRKSLIRLAIVVKRYGPDAPAPPNPQSPSAPSSISSIGSISSTPEVSAIPNPQSPSAPSSISSTPQNSAIRNPQSEIENFPYVSVSPADAAFEKQFTPPLFPGASPMVSAGTMLNYIYYMGISEDAYAKSDVYKRFTASLGEEAAPEPPESARPAVHADGGEPAIYPPDREPNLAESREIREVAAIPPDKLHAALDRVNANLSECPGPIAESAPGDIDPFPRSISSIQSISSTPQNSEIPNPQSEIRNPQSDPSPAIVSKPPPST